MTNSRHWPALCGALLVWGVPVLGQVRASEPATLSQTVDGTVITVEYSRPRTRGRTPIYGNEVKWGEVWTPGANWATTLDLSKDVTIDGHPVPKGKYSVWMQVEQGDWTVILDPKAKQFHTAHPKPDSTQIRFDVKPDSIEGPDVLLWSFPGLSTTGTVLEMAWAGRAVPLEIVVTPSHPITLASDLAPRYVGDYEFHFAPPPGPPPGDSLAPGGEGDDVHPPGAMQSTWKVAYARGMLLVDWDQPPFPEWAHMVLIRINDDWFNPGALSDGELYDVAGDLVVEFALEGGKATGFEVRGESDELLGSGVRVE